MLGDKPPPKDGTPGTARDGTPVIFVESLGRFVPTGAAKAMSDAARRQPLKGPLSGPEGLVKTPEYVADRAKRQSAADAALMDQAAKARAQSGEYEAGGREALALLGSGNTPVGSFANLRIAAGRSPLSDVMGGVLGVPTKKQTANLEAMNRIGGKLTLQNTDKLKGPMSDKDIAFLRQLSYDAGSSAEGIKRAARAQIWTAQRQRLYEQELARWEDRFGGPAVRDGRGKSFQDYWEPYADRMLPNPLLPQGTPREQANARLKQQSAKRTGQAVSLGFEPGP